MGVLLSFFSLLLIVSQFCDGLTKNNVCDTFEAYGSIDTSPNCYNDPEIKMYDIVTMMKRHVNTVEKYKVTTEDGYILTIYRIPNYKPKAVILLMHPLSADALMWPSMGNNSIAYKLVDAGHDVWLPSFRGTYISHHHVNMTERHPKYPNFSFHELSVYDTRTFINFIHNKTGREDIVYIGYSMSAVTPIIYSIEFPEEAAKRLKVCISMATPYRFLYSTSPFLQLINFPWLKKFAEDLGKALHIRAFYNSPMNKMFQSLWGTYPYNRLFALAINVLFGWIGDEFDPASLPRTMSKLPRGMSLKVYLHFWQILNSHQFAKYDYGPKNMEIYGQDNPPIYNMSKISMPVYLMYSDSDIFTAGKDAELLYNDFSEIAKKYGSYKMERVNHFSYFLGKHTTPKMIQHIIEFIHKLYP